MAVLNSSNTRIRVTSDVLISRADTAVRQIQNMENRLQAIQRVVNATKSYWIGEAGDACRQKYESEQADIDELMKRLKGQPRTLLTIAGVYKNVEETAREMSVPLPDDVIK